MIWLIATATLMGMMLGRWLRVPAVVVASAAIVLVSIVLIILEQWPPVLGLAYTVSLLCALQFGYLAGLMLPVSGGRVSASQRSADLRH